MLAKILLVGLGNPGRKYRGTRHNVGHWLIDRLKKSKVLPPEVEPVKTDAFMNASGVQVKRLVDNAGIPLNNLVVAHDDLDILLGEFRLQKARGSAGHKGAESVIASLGSSDFWRLRIGVGRPPEGIEAEDYVLEKFTPREKRVLNQLFPVLADKLVEILRNGESSSTSVNRLSG